MIILPRQARDKHVGKAPQKRGCSVFSQDAAAVPSADAEVLQKYLIANGYKTTDVVDGIVGEKTTEGIKALQVSRI
jgi:peptidoglycan hydrolase-like protein with peptidoglycan-binding domain